MDAGTSRTHQSLKLLSIFTRNIWLGRSEILHRDKETIDTKIYSVESAELRHFHENPDFLPSADRHYCKISLQRLLGSRPSVRRRWLRRVRTARSNLIRDGKTQQRMTQFLEGIQQHGNLWREHLDIPPPRNQALNRSITTQQRMTSHFPGRPPDSITNPIPNPPPSQS